VKLDFFFQLKQDPSLSPNFFSFISTKSGIEPYSRKDEYLIVSPEIGIKLRGGSYIEFKHRTARFPNGIENWSKLISSSASNWNDALKVLKLNSSAGLLSGAISILEGNQPFVSCVIEKTRSNAWAGVAIEQTDLVLKWRTQRDGSLSGGVPVRTVCIESSKESIERYLSKNSELDQFVKNVEKETGEPIIPCGYPQYLLEMAAKLKN